METRNKDSILMGKPKGKRPLEIPWRWKKNIKTNLTDVGCEERTLSWVSLIQYTPPHPL
jgi:hypothetical protein